METKNQQLSGGLSPSRPPGHHLICWAERIQAEHRRRYQEETSKSSVEIYHSTSGVSQNAQTAEPKPDQELEASRDIT